MDEADKTVKLLELLRMKDAECVFAIGHLMSPNEASIFKLAADTIERLVIDTAEVSILHYGDDEMKDNQVERFGNLSPAEHEASIEQIARDAIAALLKL